MRNRTTLDQALTIKQIYCEVYSDVIERFHLGNSNREKAISSMKKYYNIVIHNSSSKKDCRTVDDYNYIINDVSKQIEWYDDGTGKGPFFYIEKVNYLKRLARKLKQNDDAFRWLSIVPVKRYEIDETTGKKKPPYKEFKYVNINATQTPDFLTEVNEIYEKRAERRIEKLEYMQQKLNTILERTSTPEGKLGFDIEVLVDKWTNVCERVFLRIIIIKR